MSTQRKPFPPAWYQQRATVAALTGHHGPDAPATRKARARLTIIKARWATSVAQAAIRDAQAEIAQLDALDAAESEAA
ncbi:MAG TPA: hypothetical protein VF714_04290 [Jatrophihabitans sp.]|jgi:hypothetical protein